MKSLLFQLNFYSHMNSTYEMASAGQETLDHAGAKAKRISGYFGIHTFNRSAMAAYLPQDVLNLYENALLTGHTLDNSLVDAIAEGVKNWAVDKGATHYTHWFQPINNATAEKHDAFFKPSFDRSKPSLENFSGGDLAQKEPDASSFPSGGLRNTAQARGYTLWDPSSTLFILETELSKTLYIPSVYISWTGDSLDYKTPLLRSIKALDQAATAVARFFNPKVTGVKPTLGWEQEYFVVDADLYNQRPDLVLTGRTLFGNRPARNQQLEDHYFGTIPERIQDFIADFETESHKLGIPVITRHNEVAPSQYECAPMFEDVNNAVDHNLLLMNTMRRVARRHNLRVLLHEKPFAGINGSGKHNNWSLSTHEGHNLLSPSKEPGKNLSFLTFFINILAAINKNEELVRASIATPGNDHRLGANEAPPAIISVYTGEFIAEVLERFLEVGLNDLTASKSLVHTELPAVPVLELDATDRNRTSPFPFTGNKFEYRAVGASANCSAALTILQTAVADQLRHFHEAVTKRVAAGADQEAAIVAELQETLRENQRIVFNGNGYSAEWEAEAAQRGLSNLKTTPEALSAYQSEKARALFERTGVLSVRELDARYYIFAEEYIKTIELEAKLLLELGHTHILPAAQSSLSVLATNLDELSEFAQNGQLDGLKTQLGHLLTPFNGLVAALNEVREALEKLHHQEDIEHSLYFAGKTLKPACDTARAHADALELLIDEAEWRFPKYRELLFLF